MFIFEISKGLEFKKFQLRNWKTDSVDLLSKIHVELRDSDNIKLFDESLSAIL